MMEKLLINMSKWKGRKIVCRSGSFNCAKGICYAFSILILMKFYDISNEAHQILYSINTKKSTILRTNSTFILSTGNDVVFEQINDATTRRPTLPTMNVVLSVRSGDQNPSEPLLSGIPPKITLLSSVSILLDARQDVLLQELAWKCPTSTVPERIRFVKGHGAKASETLRLYSEWRSRWEKTREDVLSQYIGMPLSSSSYDSAFDRDRADWSDWNIAVEIAQRMAQEDGNLMNSGGNNNKNNIISSYANFGTVPRCIRLFARLDGDADWTDRYGHRVLVFRPAQMDEQIIPMSVYALAIVIYIDSKVNRDSYERLTVLIDTRAGVGWPNIPAIHRSMVGFVREISKLLLSLLPERLHMSLLFPVPVTLRWMWAGTAQFLEPVTAKKFFLITGPSTIDAPQPVDQLKQHLNGELVALLEHDRINNFYNV